MSLVKQSSEYILSHDSRPKYQCPLDYFVQNRNIPPSKQTADSINSSKLPLTNQNYPISLEDSEPLMVEASKKIKKDTTYSPNLSLLKVGVDRNGPPKNSSNSQDYSVNNIEVSEAPIFPHQARSNLKNTQTPNNVINIDDDDEDDCVIIEDSPTEPQTQIPQQNMIQSNLIQFPDYLNTIGIGMNQSLLPFQNAFDPLPLFQPFNSNPIALLQQQLQKQILLNYMQGIPNILAQKQIVLENTEADRDTYVSTISESKKAPLEIIMIDEDESDQSGEMLEESPEEKPSAYQIKKDKRRPKIEKVERSLNTKRNFEETENEAPKRRLIGRPKKQIEKFEVFDATDPNPVEISTSLQVAVPKFELNRDNACRKKLKSIWNPDNVPRNVLENYFTKLEGKIESEITNEESVINFLRRFNLDADKALENVDSDVAFYKRFFRLTRKRTQKNYYTLLNQ